jgi:hypothetical protein
MKKNILYLMLALVVFSCREKFTADIKSPPTGYLIVEGNINVGTDAVTTINLSYSTPLDSIQVKPENNATIFIEDRQNTQYPLRIVDPGVYQSDPLQLPLDKQYRVHIITSNGSEYYSSFTDTKTSPPIDSVSWEIKNGGVEVQVTTHDDNNNSKYYQWSFDETWEYVSEFYTVLKWEGNGLQYRTNADPQIRNCWSTAKSNNIIIASSAKLQQDLIFKKPVAFISFSNSDRLVKKYSILVNQSVISSDAYEYLERMRKNSEQLGSIFDAQPSQLRGNVRSRRDSGEIVVGHVGASTVTQKRIFIERQQIGSVPIRTFYESCIIDTVDNIPLEIRRYFEMGDNIPTEYYAQGIFILGVIYSNKYCVDCRERGGTNIKPPYWP